tara:strand:- start:37 stop:414 length:378 start_codon:yes stop_codon:yes gene_type:complete
MSIEMIGQMYIVNYTDWTQQYNNDGKRYIDDNGEYMYERVVEIIIEPSGNTSIRVVPFKKVPFAGLFKNDNKIELLQTINSTLNNIMAKGYTLMANEQIDLLEKKLQASKTIDKGGLGTFILVKK